MATFVENETDEKGNPKKISLGQDEIELGILKQLFYKVNYKRYRRADIESCTKLIGNVFGDIWF